MKLLSTGTSLLIYSHRPQPTSIQKDPARALAALIAQGHSVTVAREAAHGYLSREAALRLGKTISLLQ